MTEPLKVDAEESDIEELKTWRKVLINERSAIASEIIQLSNKISALEAVKRIERAAQEKEKR